MLGPTRQVRVLAFTAPVDMRKSYDTLSAVVTQELGRDVLAGDVFLFVGQTRKRAKVYLRGHRAREDIEQLRKAALVLAAENQRLVTKVTDLTKQLLKAQGKDAEQLQLQIAELEHQLAARNKLLFGKSSEKRSRSTGNKDKAPQKGHGPRQQPLLDVVEPEPFELDQADRVCTSCGGGSMSGRATRRIRGDRRDPAALRAA
jgi:hypothetical protein